MSINHKYLDELFDSFNNLKVLIIGDVMLDAYYWGKVDRISPEAPVPIVSVEKRDQRMGGAANVALNIKALGANPILCSIIGQDDAGDAFLDLVEKNEHSKKAILRLSSRKTTQKTRIIGNNHQMLRIDSEETDSLNAEDESMFIDHIKKNLSDQNIDVVIFEDYDKGVITENIIRETVDFCMEHDIPTCVDPKKRNFTAYKNVNLFKPNLKELKEGLKLNIDLRDLANLTMAIDQQEGLLVNQITLVTLSEKGVFIKSGNSKHHIKAHQRDITDVSGAGDTVISVASLCLALACDIKLIAELANLAGGIVCEYVGVVPIKKEHLLVEAKRLLVK